MGISRSDQGFRTVCFFWRESYSVQAPPLISTSVLFSSSMDLDKSSPENSPPDHRRRSTKSSSPTMATMVVNGSSSNMPGPVKRYRPAPAKTFQCRGYGECRMVFSRSEHLARHIRFVPYLYVKRFLTGW